MAEARQRTARPPGDKFSCTRESDVAGGAPWITNGRTLKTEASKTEKDFGKDLKALEQLPTQTRELLILPDQTEKSTGQEKVDLHKLTRDNSKAGAPRLPTSG